ncbi:MAG TPA: sigma-70 family RNA polymerase sigma factor [Vicinamibacteria bacterium]|nr:sigma-70 family RNA polymerase sigma factor [Vicinamibacteria bacterium]
MAIQYRARIEPSSSPDPQASGGSTTTLALLRRARDGDRDALDGLFARLLPSLRRWAHGRLPGGVRDLSDTADLVQHAIVGALRHLDRFEPRRRDALRAYLRQAIRNRVLDELRRHGRRPLHVPMDGADLAAEAGLSPLARLLSREQEERLHRAMDRLRAEDRELVIARLDLGYNYSQIALATGRPSPDAARMAVHRALLRLAEEMGAD